MFFIWNVIFNVYFIVDHLTCFVARLPFLAVRELLISFNGLKLLFDKNKTATVKNCFLSASIFPKKACQELTFSICSAA